MHLADVLIHVSERPNKSEQDELVNHFRSLDGVIAPRFNEGKDHLLVVSYISGTINSAALLEKVRENGFEAQLVGL